PITSRKTKVLSTIHNIPKRMKSASFRETRRAPGKENIPPGTKTQKVRLTTPSILLSGIDPSIYTQPANAELRWLPKDGQIIIKVSVPATDDIWKVRVPEDVTLDAFLRKVEDKVGFAVVLSAMATERCAKITTERAFRCWVQTRVRNGRNHPITAHRTL
ncbi:hypothetical protein OBBRIDRAFT_691697, partial [Obba rivulosa]